VSRQSSEYLDRVRAIAPLRVYAGFGIGSRSAPD
jgi:tryptophan synthase alpha subunit